MLEKTGCCLPPPWAPPDRSTLPLRLLAWTILEGDAFDVVATASQSLPYADPRQLAENLVPGGGDLRERLRMSYDGKFEASLPTPPSNWGQLTTEQRLPIIQHLRDLVLEVEIEFVEILIDETT